MRRATLASAVDATDLAVNEALLELRSAEQRLKDVSRRLTDLRGRPSSGRGMAPRHQWAQSGDELFVLPSEVRAQVGRSCHSCSVRMT